MSDDVALSSKTIFSWGEIDIHAFKADADRFVFDRDNFFRGVDNIAKLEFMGDGLLIYAFHAALFELGADFLNDLC